eukprot:1360303-Amorphochlora_amoeboformis.AAC.2
MVRAKVEGALKAVVRRTLNTISSASLISGLVLKRKCLRVGRASRKRRDGVMIPGFKGRVVRTEGRAGCYPVGRRPWNARAETHCGGSTGDTCLG